MEYHVANTCGTNGKEPTSQCRRCKRCGIWSQGWEDPLEEGMAIHSSILTWRIPWTEEPGGLQSIGSQRVGHNWATSLKGYAECKQCFTKVWLLRFHFFFFLQWNYYSATKRDKILSLAVTWMDWWNKSNTDYHSHVESKKYNKLLDITKQKQIHR